MSEALLAKRAELERELVRRREACSSWAERRLLSQLQSHTSKMKRLQKRQLQEDGWEKRRLGVSVVCREYRSCIILMFPSASDNEGAHVSTLDR